MLDEHQAADVVCYDSQQSLSGLAQQTLVAFLSEFDIHLQGKTPQVTALR